MSLRASAAGLAEAGKHLSLQWEETKVHWHDAKSREFQELFLEELPDRIARTLAAMETLDSLLRKVRHDCE